jgi:hypothetical protein
MKAKELRDLDVNEMARVEGGFAYGGDGYCGTVVPGQFFHPPHGGGGDPWTINLAAVSKVQVNPILAGGLAVGKIGGF